MKNIFSIYIQYLNACGMLVIKHKISSKFGEIKVIEDDSKRWTQLNSIKQYEIESVFLNHPVSWG